MSLIPQSATLAAKRLLRRRVLARRAALSPGERAAASARILTQLLDLPAFQQARGVHAFVSFPDEVDTAPLLRACAGAGKAIFLPYQVPARDRLGCARWDPRQPLVPGPFGTQEPPMESRGAVDLSAIDLVLVPGVAFDRRGGRLGYGKGYYDRFLTDLMQAHGRPNTSPPIPLPLGGGGGREAAGGEVPALVALAFSVQIVEAVPLNAWDVRIPLLLTEHGLLTTA
jgi:5-formyltetrahydrofolate cyclo-ligase